MKRTERTKTPRKTPEQIFQDIKLNLSELEAQAVSTAAYRAENQSIVATALNSDIEYSTFSLGLEKQLHDLLRQARIQREIVTRKLSRKRTLQEIKLKVESQAIKDEIQAEIDKLG